MSKERARIRIEFEEPVAKPNYVVVCAINNVGLTPALFTTAAFACHLSSTEGSMRHQYDLEPLIAGGRSTRKVMISPEVTEEQWQAIMNRSLYLFASAKVKYMDVFDVCHETSIDVALGTVVETWKNPPTCLYFWYQYSEEDNKST